MQCLPYWSTHLCADYHSAEKKLKLGCEGFRTETVSSYSCICPCKDHWTTQAPGTRTMSLFNSLFIDACSWGWQEGHSSDEVPRSTCIVHIHMKLPLCPQSLVCVPHVRWSFGHTCWITKADANRAHEIHRRWDEFSYTERRKEFKSIDPISWLCPLNSAH